MKEPGFRTLVRGGKRERSRDGATARGESGSERGTDRCMHHVARYVSEA